MLLMEVCRLRRLLFCRLKVRFPPVSLMEGLADIVYYGGFLGGDIFDFMRIALERKHSKSLVNPFRFEARTDEHLHLQAAG
ncbi:hypothetical protein Q1695_000313 [Nippostrongylus brasiliensis]|nr:hypothetical protein Q1695_000313 [Nippostrongylus brasiliensis]